MYDCTIDDLLREEIERQKRRSLILKMLIRSREYHLTNYVRWKTLSEVNV